MKILVRCAEWAVLGIALASCATVGRESAVPPAPLAVEDLRARATGLAPQGWRLYDKVLQFTPENLYEQIDGRAELFLAYDVSSLTFADFERTADARRSLDLSIYDMGTPTLAFGVFSAERSGSEIPVNLGRAAYRSGSNVYVWKGRYYVQVIALSAAEDVQQPAMQLAQKAADALPDSGEPVWGLAALPKKDRVPDSVRYFQVDALGLDFLSNTYTAQYRKRGAVVDVFLSQQDSAESAQTAMDRYAEYAAKYGKGLERLRTRGCSPLFLVCDVGGAFDVVFRKGRLVGGVTAAKDRTKAITAALEFCRQLRKRALYATTEFL